MPLGVELLEPVELLADADELDRHPGDFLDRQGRAAAGVAVELGQDDAVEFQRVVERLGAVDGVLAGHRVADEVDLVRLDQPVDLLQLVHRHFVDVQPAGGVEDDGVEQRLLGVGDGVAADVDRVGRRSRCRPGTPICSPSTLSCSTAAGRCKSAATSSGLRPLLAAAFRASLPAVVVLPLPCRPQSMRTVGRSLAKWKLWSTGPISSTSSS